MPIRDTGVQNVISADHTSSGARQQEADNLSHLLHEFILPINVFYEIQRDCTLKIKNNRTGEFLLLPKPRRQDINDALDRLKMSTNGRHFYLYEGGVIEVQNYNAVERGEVPGIQKNSDIDAGIFASLMPEKKKRAVRRCACCNDTIKSKKVNHFGFGNEFFCDKPECKKVFEKKYTECQDCGDVTYVEEIKKVMGHKVCARCYRNNYRECEQCGKIERESVSRYLCDEWYCSACYDRLFFRCPGCNSIYRRGDGYGDPDNNNTIYCESCTASRNRVIKQYNWIPSRFEPKGVKEIGSNLLFGFELEVENTNKHDVDNELIAKKICKDLTCYSAYCKKDGSLTCGFELVTHPFSWEYFKSHKQELKDTFRFLIKKGFKSFKTETCGFHVHMNIKAFGSLQSYKLQKLIYANPLFFTAIAKRSAERWAKYSIRKATQIQRSVRKRHNDRYCAVRFTPHTLEMRIFKGTLKASSVFMYLEVCKSLYDFTQQNAINHVVKARYLDFVFENKENFPNLVKFFTKKEW